MADVELVLVTWSAARFPNARFCTEFPADVNDALPICRLVRVGGPRLYVIDNPTVAVDWLGATRETANAAAREYEQALYLELPGNTVSGATIGHVATVSGPSWAPWDNTTVRRMTATYRLHLKDA